MPIANTCWERLPGDLLSVPAEDAWLQQMGRPPRGEEDNWYSRLLGTHPLKSLPPRVSHVRLERLPSSAGISPLKPFSKRFSRITRPSSLVVTRSRTPMGASLSQLSLKCQFSPFVAL